MRSFRLNAEHIKRSPDSRSRRSLRGGVGVASPSPRYRTGHFTLSAHPTHASRCERADERTRTADLLITSALSLVRSCFQSVQESLAEAAFGYSTFLEIPRCLLRLLSRLLSKTAALTLLQRAPLKPLSIN